MGQVWLGEDTLLARPVAVKFAELPRGGHPEHTRARFLLEGRAVARLRHRNVVAAYHAGEVDGHPFLVTELLDGVGLDRLSWPVAPDQVLRIGAGLARGLEAAHRASILHRDIKPANAFLCRDGTAKLLDFGLAQLVDAGPAMASVPGDGAAPPPGDGLLGTPLYLAPEQWRGEAATVRSDLYSLGAVLYQLLSGEAPHDGASIAELRARVGGPIRPLRELARSIPSLLADAVERCLGRWEQRPRSAGELCELLEEAARVLASGGGSAATGPPPATNPYRGLLAFREEDRDIFFGRETVVDTVIDRLRQAAVVAVAGRSGTGKSSLLHAGVVPRARGGALAAKGTAPCAVVSLRPGAHPSAALASAVAAAAGDAEPATVDGAVATLRRLGEAAPVLLVLDQFEECFTLAAPEEREAWRALLEQCLALPSVRAVISLRSDFLERLGELGALGAEILRSAVILGPLSRAELRRAIVEPARRRGCSFESEAMIDELLGGDEGGALPLLQFALAQLWETPGRPAALLGHADLVALGGIAGALSRHADGTIAALPEAQRREARRLLLELVTVEGTRARKEEHELMEGARDRAAALAALAALVAGRLLTVDEGDRSPSYQLGHEALITGWPRLAGWLLEEAAVRRTVARVEGAAGEWERLGRPAEALLTSARLEEVATLGADALPPRVRGFVGASRAAHSRAARLRWSLRLGLPLLAFAALGLTTALWRVRVRALDRARIEERLAAARAGLRVAEETQRGAEESRAGAWRAFDEGDRAKGEHAWAAAVAAMDLAGRRYAEAAAEADRARAIDRTHAEAARVGAVIAWRWLLAVEHQPGAERLVGELGRRLDAAADPDLRAARAAPARLRVRVRSGVALRLQEIILAPSGRRLEGTTRPIAAGAWAELAPGSYVVLAKAVASTTRLPILLERGEARTVDLALPLAPLPDGLRYVPSGEMRFGSPDAEPVRRALGAEPERPASVPGFLISDTETTFGEYLAFLRTLPPDEAARRRPSAQGLDLRLLPGGRARLELLGAVAAEGAPWCPSSKTARPRCVADWSRLPVTGISFADAQRFAGWLASTGRIPGARLCEAREWERAARGADGRRYPAGDRLAPGDANVEAPPARDGPLPAGPAPVGTFPGDLSPFLVHDLAGNVFEMVLPRHGAQKAVLRGGAWDAEAVYARAYGEGAAPDERFISVGLRICAPPPATG